MIVLTGKGVFEGVRIGKIAFYKRDSHLAGRRNVEDTEAELERFYDARRIAVRQLQELYEKAFQNAGKENARIFEMHQMILEDPDYIEPIVHIITEQKVNAEYAVRVQTENLAAQFTAMNDAYMRERAADVKDVSNRVQYLLSGKERSGIITKTPVIVAAQELTPSDVVCLDRNMVLGIAVAHGAFHSHAMLLARAMDIPIVTDLGETLKPEYDGMLIAIDGFSGRIYVDPDEETLDAMRQKQKKELQELRDEENIASDRQKINICANIDDCVEIERALQSGADGIGLLRSEFLYLKTDKFPTEEQQFQVYRMAAEKMAGKKVVIRTLDMGADKRADYFSLDEEENPALGYRGIRICLVQPDIFKTQLRALLRASFYGRIAILFPMIISVSEVRQIKEILEEVKTKLRQDRVRFDEAIEIGIMIETPAAVMESRKLAKEVDFFSVGTNDLTQYTLALDRQNPKLEQFYDAHHPAVLSMIEMAVDNAHAEGKKIGICGELGADLELTETFLKMGIDELSVLPSMILPLQKKVRETLSDRKMFREK